MGVYTTYNLQYNVRIINLIYIKSIIILITRRFKHMKWGGEGGDSENDMRAIISKNYYLYIVRTMRKQGNVLK